jgi:SAM-dependent methyltransferase
MEHEYWSKVTVTKMPLKLHLGCGFEYLEGFVNCDCDSSVKPDLIVDLEKKLPFKDSSVDEIFSVHCFEHIQNLHGLMKELHRVCKRGAKLKIIVPYFQGIGAFNNPDHKRFFGKTTMDFYEEMFEVVKVRRVPALISKSSLKDPLYALDTLIRRTLKVVWLGRHEGIEYTLMNKERKRLK